MVNTACAPETCGCCKTTCARVGSRPNTSSFGRGGSSPACISIRPSAGCMFGIAASPTWNWVRKSNGIVVPGAICTPFAAVGPEPPSMNTSLPPPSWTIAACSGWTPLPPRRMSQCGALPMTMRCLPKPGTMRNLTVSLTNGGPRWNPAPPRLQCRCLRGEAPGPTRRGSLGTSRSRSAPAAKAKHDLRRGRRGLLSIHESRRSFLSPEPKKTNGLLSIHESRSTPLSPEPQNLPNDPPKRDSQHYQHANDRGDPEQHAALGEGLRGDRRARRGVRWCAEQRVARVGQERIVRARVQG